MSLIAANAAGCTDFRSTQCHWPACEDQHLCLRVAEKTSRTAFQNPSAPTPAPGRSFRDGGNHATDRHQQAQLLLFEADLEEVDTVDPQVHVIAAREVMPVERLGALT